MLVLTRKRGEAIRIGDGVTVSVVQVRQGKVLLGIDAPETVPVVRTELAAEPTPPPAAGRPEPPVERSAS